MSLGSKLYQLVLVGKARQQFEPSKNALRRQAFTATADVEEEHVTLPHWCKRNFKKHVKRRNKEIYEMFMKYYREEFGIKRKVIVKRGRFLIGQYLDRSKYNSDGSLKGRTDAG